METKEKKYITFSKNMIAGVHEHSDKNKIDINTNEVMKIASVRLPSADYRTHRFGVDANGIDRDSREATINVVDSYIYDNRDSDGNFLNHFTYLDPNREYNVNFKGQIIGQENGKNIFDKPERAKLTGAELTKLFREDVKFQKKKQKKKKIKNRKKQKRNLQKQQLQRNRKNRKQNQLDK